MSRTDAIMLTLPNVSYKKHEIYMGKARNNDYDNIGIDKDLCPLIQRIALKHPEWVLEASGSNRYRGDEGEKSYYICTMFQILEKGEDVGRICIGKNYSKGVPQFEITNKRIRDNLQRGSALKTMTLEKAVKLVEKHFSTRTVNELWEEQMKHADTELENLRDRLRSSFNYMWRSDGAPMMQYILKHWDDFAATLDDAEKLRLGEFPVLHERGKVAHDMYQQVTTGKVIRVMLLNNNYVVSNGDASFSSFDHDHLPEGIRRKLGLLKLVEDNTMLEGVGYRVNETTFLLYREENAE